MHRVDVKRFAIGKYAVTNAEFAAFLNETGDRGSQAEPWFEDKSADTDDSRIKIMKVRV